MSSVVWCIDSLQRLLADLPRFEDSRVLSTRNVDVILNQLEIVYSELSAVDAVGELDTQGGSALMRVAQAIEEVRQLEQSTAVSVTAYMSPVVCDGTVGKLQYLIPQDVLGSLLETGFSLPQIASILSVSIQTARRRCNVQCIPYLVSKSLTQLFAAFSRSFHFVVYNRQMMDHLRAQGIRVQQNRVRESQQRIDPGGCMMKRLSTIHRRTYRVNGTLSLWHIDENNKLIR